MVLEKDRREGFRGKGGSAGYDRRGIRFSEDGHAVRDSFAGRQLLTVCRPFNSYHGLVIRGLQLTGPRSVRPIRDSVWH